VAKRLDGSRCHLVQTTKVVLGPVGIVLDRDQSCPPKRGTATVPRHFSAHFALARSPISATAEHFSSFTCSAYLLQHGARGATTFSKLGVQFLGLGYYTEQNTYGIPSSCTAVCSYVKSWGGRSKCWGSGPPPPAPSPSGCALAWRSCEHCSVSSSLGNQLMKRDEVGRVIFAGWRHCSEFSLRGKAPYCRNSAASISTDSFARTRPGPPWKKYRTEVLG